MQFQSSEIAFITTFLMLASVFLFVVLYVHILSIYLSIEITQHDSGTEALRILDILLGLGYWLY